MVSIGSLAATKGNRTAPAVPAAWPRRRKLWLAVLAMGTALTAGLAVLPIADAGRLSGIGAARSFLAMLEDRSPGERTTAELTKIKRRVAAKSGPTQRALAKIRTPDLPVGVVEKLLAPPPELAELLMAPPAFDGFTLAEVPPPGGPIVVLPPGGTPPGGGGGGGGGTTPPEQTPPETPPVSPVPEPGTWATMLLGFWLTGWALRRQRGNAARPAFG